MIRKALIIGNPGDAGSDRYCRGVDNDVQNLSVFLKSPAGGAWRDDEIAIRRGGARGD